MPTSSELVAHQRSEEEVAQAIGADMMIYQDLDDLVESCRKWNPEINAFDVSVFNGCYVTSDISQVHTQTCCPIYMNSIVVLQLGRLIS
jgi:amidophosphoribosyltransferase